MANLLDASKATGVPSERHRKRTLVAFTLLELLVVIACIATLASLLLTAVFKAKARAQAIQCVNNMKQLQLAWHLYADDHNDRIAGNFPGDASGKEPDASSWVAGTMCYETQLGSASCFSDSTNTLLLVPGGYGTIGGYTKNAAIYKCPADKSWILLGGARHSRVRSVSMNCFMGWNVDSVVCRTFHKVAEVTTPSPSQAFVFLEEHEDSINDGFFIVDVGFLVGFETWWVDLPANRHNGAAAFSFADGHIEIKKWLDPRTRKPVERNYVNIFAQFNNKDIVWLQERATSRR